MAQRVYYLLCKHGDPRLHPQNSHKCHMRYNASVTHSISWVISKIQENSWNLKGPLAWGAQQQIIGNPISNMAEGRTDTEVVP